MRAARQCRSCLGVSGPLDFSAVSHTVRPLSPLTESPSPRLPPPAAMFETLGRADVQFFHVDLGPLFLICVPLKMSSSPLEVRVQSIVTFCPETG